MDALHGSKRMTKELELFKKWLRTTPEILHATLRDILILEENKNKIIRCIHTEGLPPQVISLDYLVPEKYHAEWVVGDVVPEEEAEELWDILPKGLK